ncbi:hypothetical protein [Flavobacterium chungangense]|uniref:Lipoprotein n=1 Tax=Flavobacterium chungangense TaxID=554283 RepID=A0A6V6YQM0_9FLAO|nr:hypothetical protein [Flavobacterium chungangense]CAD0001750.1 hypothetical protein FLACHUCJ7_00624 [Flavobacterium chungangense]
MKKNILIITSIILFGCNNSKKADLNKEKVVKKELRPFFDSDQICHYYLGSTSDFEHLSNDKAKQTEKKKEFSTFFYGYYPKNVEKSFEKLLLKYKYKKSNLSIKQQKQIEGIFSEKDSLKNDACACIAEYRDIFIFKKEGKTVGIAKICFKNARFQITGSKIDTEDFGLIDKLDRLKKIVRPENYSILITE